MPIAVWLLSLFLWLTGCGTDRSGGTVHSLSADTVAVKTGAQVLAEDKFALLQGKRVGLIVNHTARLDTTHLIDALHAAEGVTLAAIFGPEHGFRGQADAGEKVQDGRDPRTGVPVYSLYGQTRKPTPEMLQDLDVLVFDIQDVGARFYTYISTMGLAMQAAAEAGLPFVVLDRPNPLGGNYVSGFVLAPRHTSFIGAYDIPVAHGLTVGELARMIQGAPLLPNLETLDLTVVPMQGWRRTMRWPQTTLPWIAPSPNLPTFETALIYPGACFFEATATSEGRGTLTPFQLLGAPWINGPALADTLNRRNLPGVYFEASSFTPRSIPGMSSHPKLEGVALEGIRYRITDVDAFLPVETGMHVLQAFYALASEDQKETFVASPDGLARLAGTERLFELLTHETDAATIIQSWEEEVQRFAQHRQPFLLYE